MEGDLQYCMGRPLFASAIVWLRSSRLEGTLDYFAISTVLREWRVWSGLVCTALVCTALVCRFAVPSTLESSSTLGLTCLLHYFGRLEKGKDSLRFNFERSEF